jgi:Zn-dependent protease with chaperone function
MMLAKRRKILYGIDPRSWEHPADKAALAGLRQLKGFDELLKGFVSLTNERSMRLMALASAVKVTKTQYPRIDAIRDEVVEIFDWPTKPDIFVTQSPFLNAGVLGVNDPFIILNNSTLKLLDDELGHVMSGHALYKSLIWIVTNIALQMLPIPMILVYGIVAALMEWDRKSELTADRAEMLAVQDGTPPARLLMKLSGGDNLKQVNLDDFYAQAREYEEMNSLIDSVHKLLNTLWTTHPAPVIRLQELKKWEDSGYYQAILDGHYIRRDYRTDRTAEDIKEGFQSYKEDMRNSTDPLGKFAAVVADKAEEAAAEVGDSLGKVAEGFKQGFNDIAKQAGDAFSNLFGNQQKPMPPEPTDDDRETHDAEQ